MKLFWQAVSLFGTIVLMLFLCGYCVAPKTHGIVIPVDPTPNIQQTVER